MAQDISFDITPEKEASKAQFLRRQFSGAIPALSRDDVNLSGRTIIVTGANGGIGLEICRQLLALGLTRLILAVRDEANGEAVCQILNTKAVERGQFVEVWKLGYGSYESIMEFARRAQSLYPRPDTAILNAGVNRGSFALNLKTGHEEDLQTNYLSTALLVLLLLRVFKRAQSPDLEALSWQRIQYADSPSEPFRPGRIVRHRIVRHGRVG